MIDMHSNVLGHDEDAVAIPLGDTYLVLNIDGWVASSDRPPGMALHDCGYRAVVNAASDLIAKGARPEAMIISLSLPNASDARAILEGAHHAADEYNIAYLGGDLNSSTDIVVDVVIVGKATKLIRRSGAQVGDIVYWLGPSLGGTAAALGILLKGWEGDRQMALDIMGRPKLYDRFLECTANAAIDCSDGLARSLYILADQSQVRIEIEETWEHDPWVFEVSQKNMLSYMELVLYGGEELGIVFTLPENQNPPQGSIKLGRVCEGSAVFLDQKQIENRGWDHFE